MNFVPLGGKAGLERFWEKGILERCLVSLYALEGVGRAIFLAGVKKGEKWVKARKTGGLGSLLGVSGPFWSLVMILNRGSTLCVAIGIAGV